ncbi:MAG TPA: LysR family transcriptional regulator [Bordetella sp.]
MRGLNLDHLRIFLDVIEHGSFSAAAERHGLSQPAVSQQVRQLERRYGLRLAERVGRRVTATAAGQALLDYARRIDAVAAEADRAMQSHAAGVGGRVLLGTGGTACTYLLPPLLATLRGRFPDLDVVVRTGNTADVLRGIEDNVLDIGLVTLPAAGRMFQVTPVLDDDFVAIFPAGEAGLPARATPAELARRPLVLFEPGARTRRLCDDWFEAAGVPARPVMELGSTEAMKEIVAAGLGCAVLPGLAVTGSGARASLAVRPLRPRLRRQLAVVLRHDKPVGRGLRQVVELLQGLRGQPGRGAGAGRPR